MPQRGQLDLYAFADQKKYGAGAELLIKMGKNLGAYASGQYGLSGAQAWWNAHGGLRLNW